MGFKKKTKLQSARKRNRMPKKSQSSKRSRHKFKTKQRTKDVIISHDLCIGDKGLVVYTDGSSVDSKFGGSGFHGYIYTKKAPFSTGQRFSPKNLYVTSSGYAKHLDGIDEVQVDSYMDGCHAYKDCTNNKAELSAIISFLNIADSSNYYGAKRIHFISDSKYVLDGIQKWRHGWAKSGWVKSDKDPIKNLNEWIEVNFAIIKAEACGVEMSYSWVKGHSSNIGNDRADFLALVGRRMSHSEKYDPVFMTYDPIDYWSKTSYADPIAPDYVWTSCKGSEILTGGSFVGDGRYAGSIMLSAMTFGCQASPDIPRMTDIVERAKTAISDDDENAFATNGLFYGFPYRDVSAFGEYAVKEGRSGQLTHGDHETTVSIKKKHLDNRDEHIDSTIQSLCRILKIMHNGSGEVDSWSIDQESTESDLSHSIVDVSEHVYTDNGTKRKHTLALGKDGIVASFNYYSPDGEQNRSVKLAPGVNMPTISQLGNLEAKRPVVSIVILHGELAESCFIVIESKGFCGAFSCNDVQYM